MAHDLGRPTGMWKVADRLAVRTVAGASLVYAAGFAAGHAMFAILYAILLYRERTEQA